MKKSILFLATLLCTLAASATVINGTPNPGEYGRVQYWVHTVASPGDTILLADGTYDEKSVINFNKEGIVVMAKEGATPIIKTKGAWMEMIITATTTFEGILFESDDSDRDQYGFTNSANLTFRNCTFKDFTKYVIKTKGTNGTESLIVEDCVFEGEGITPNAIQIEGNAVLTCQNSTFTNHADYSIYVESGANTSLTIDGCEFDGTNTTKAALFTKGIVSVCDIQGTEFKNFAECAITVQKWYGGRFDALTINDCLIHDCTQSAIYLPYAIDTNEKQTCSDFKLTNSTIYNIGNGSDYAAIDIKENSSIPTEQQALIDHLTIYNIQTSASEGAITIANASKTTISNCIIASPEQNWIDSYNVPAEATIQNCLVHNQHLDADWTSIITNADPMFVDAANADFMLYAESPAVGTGTDGSNLGDPRWGVKPGIQAGAGKLKEAVDAAQAGETIELGDETYEVSSSIDFDVEGLTIKAAEGTKPIIKTTDQWTELQISASTTFEGITFDGGDLTKVSVSTFGTTTQTLTLKNCEFKNYTDCNVNIASETSINTIAIENCVFDGGASTPNAIYSKGIATTCTIENTEFKNYTTHCISAGDYYRGRFDNLSINNCLLHDSPVAVYMPKYADAGNIQTCANFSLTNSTIYNMVCTTSNAVIDIRSNPNDAIEDLNKVVIDHITIYNFDATYGAIYIAKTNDMSITNSIIATPEDKGQRALYVYGGTVDNTIHFNGSTRTGNTVYTKCENVDPMFVGATEANFDIYANSPAVGAGTDGSNLGDPRWGVSASIKGKVINITPGQAKLNNAVGDASMGDTIVLADGTYDEPWGFDLDKEGLVIMAAKGATPVVELSSADGWTTFTLSATTTFDGITFDGKAVCKYMLQTNATDISKLAFYNCEFRNYAKYAISNPDAGGTHVDSVIIDNCLFHDGAGSAVNFNNKGYNGDHACSYFKMTNSSVYNIGSSANAAITIRANDDATGAQNKVIIDHITLYNYATSEYGGIAIRKTKDLQITNSIIANPSAGLTAIYHYSEVQNNLFHNVTLKTSDGAAYNAACITADPLFVDAANGNFKLKGNSLAVYAGTDGTTLGDPRWGITPLELNGEGDDAKVLSNYNGKVADVKITRDFVTGDGYNTICLPFDMPANKIGNAYQIETINAYANDEIEVKFAPVTTLLAGQPYLIVPNKTELEEVKQVTITNQAGTTNTVSGGGVSIKMTGVLSENGTTSGLYWVGEQGWLYNGDVRKLGLRAYFEIDINTPSGIAPRMRVVTSENEATGLDNITTNEKAIKAIVNGQLVIIRGGEMYNVQGQKL